MSFLELMLLGGLQALQHIVNPGFTSLICKGMLSNTIMEMRLYNEYNSVKSAHQPNKTVGGENVCLNVMVNVV